MSYLGMGIVFAAIAFVLANVVLTLAVVGAWPALRHRVHRPGALFLLRMIPALGATMAAAGLALPAYFSFEPLKSGEKASAALLAFVVLSAVIVAAGVVRASGSWLTTRRLERSWRLVAEPGTIGGVAVHRVPTALPFAALVGIVRPRLYVSATLLDVLSDDQRAAVLAHEAGHGRAFDNVKRGLARFAPDLLVLTVTGRAIDDAWSAAAEESADDHAAVANGRLAVAAALLAASRMAPVRLATVGNFCDAGTIAHRVERLLEEPQARSTGKVAGLLSISVLAVAGAAAVASLPLVYAATESIIRRLQ
ncbi:MAG TPA: M48 family metalloprotease [Candidatus Polarisedimenticolaceae bacterium]|nr:M48 family metalloprotease [Candidatus Polarisedimenticolaceae bacterium]